VTEARLLFLSQEDVVAAGGLEIGATIEVVERALRPHAEGDAVLPPKVAIHWGDDLGSEEREGRIMAMPATSAGISTSPA
jgi:N-[(2S)-2-amino-2-carboxyethyl]-L-glutamate dehydrogenase